MDSLDKLNRRMEKLNNQTDRIGRFIRDSGWNGSVEKIKYGDQTSDPAIYLDVATDKEEVRFTISPDGTANVWEGYRIVRTIDAGFSVGDVLRVLYDDYSDMENTPWDEAVS